MRSYKDRYAREAAWAAGAFASEASLFRALLAETDAALHQAWHEGRLPAGIISNDLIRRTHAALTGETKATPPTVGEVIADAAAELSKLGGHRL